MSGARGVAAPVPHTGQCRRDSGTNSQRKKRADLQMENEHSQQQARTCEDWLRQEDREPTDGESDTRAMMCIRWEEKVKFLTAEVLRGVNSTIFDAHGAGLIMTSSLEQDCDSRQDSRGATTGAARHRRCSRFRRSAVVVLRRDHRHHCLDAEAETTVRQRRFQQTVKIPQSKDSEGHGDSPGWRIQKTMEIPQVGGFRRPWRFHS